ncbi:hypothetical protein [Streptomyces sp. S.PB5]|nr:hypothetical protein [Streptomyces sp. S.PB5]MDN3027559.1 hypothetical protein [Streptomyces sp. S.PB5]
MTGSSEPESLIMWAAVTLVTGHTGRRSSRHMGRQPSREHERD